ncbi:MAG: hypothetical protein ACE5JX_14655 [Acidobacteriota bacterium]
MQFNQIDWASDQQKEIFEYGPFPVVASGGFNAGKTFAFVLKAIWLSMMFPRNRGLIGRKVHKELVETTMETFKKICFPDLYDPKQGGRWNEQQGILRFTNGSSVLWMHLDQRDVMGTLRGLEINWFFLDQAEEIPEEPVNVLMKRLGRWDKVEVPEDTIAAMGWTPENWPWRKPTGQLQCPPYAMFACNPSGKDHWLYKRFHPQSPYHHLKQFPLTHRDATPVLDEKGEPAMQSYHDMGYHMVNCPSYSNKYATDQNLAEMRRGSEQWRRLFYHGEWGFTKGQIHDVKSDSILVSGTRSGIDLEGTRVDVGEVLSYLHHCCSIYRTLDHGDSGATCCLWCGVDEDNNCIFFQEYYQKDDLISNHRSVITMLSEDWNIKASLADPSIFYRAIQKDGARWTVAHEYSDTRILPKSTAISWRRADNNELGTRNRINEYLKLDYQRKHPFTGNHGSPRIFFLMQSDDYLQGINYAYHETVAQMRMAKGEEAGETIWTEERNPNIADDAYDPVRYLVASRPIRGEESIQATAGTGPTVNDLMKNLTRRPSLRFH